MPSSAVRDDGTIAVGLTQWLAHRDGRVAALSRPATGWSNETVIVTLGTGDRMVVRLPPLIPSFPHDALEVEARVLHALEDASIPAPRLIAYEADTTWLGAPFLAMTFVDGRTVGEAPTLDPWIADASRSDQRQIVSGFLDTLALVHALDTTTANLDVVLRRGLADELEYWSAYVAWAAGDEKPSDVLVDAFAWCAANAPMDEPPASLLWGDARLANVMYDEDRTVRAFLDWELATIGPAEMDVAWYLVLDDLTSKIVGRRVDGFLARDEFIAAHERALGRKLEAVAWHEVFALARSIAINDRQARIASGTGVAYPGVAGDDNPMLHVLSRRIERHSGTAEGPRW